MSAHRSRVYELAYRLVNRLSRRGIDAFVHAGLDGVEGPVLNLGCGTRLAGAGARVREVGLDVRARPEAHVRGDAHELPFADGAFAAVVCMEVLEHLHSPERVASEIRRVLRPGAPLVLTTRFMFHIHGAPVDYLRFTRHGLEFVFREFAELRVVPQHGGYASFLVMLGRLITEDAKLFRWLALPIALAVNALALLEPLAERLAPAPSVTTGYFVSCRRGR